MSSKEDGVWPSSFEGERSMTIRGGGHGMSSRQEGVWPSSSKRERSMTMAILLPSLVKSCSGGHGRSSEEEEVCYSYP